MTVKTYDFFISYKSEDSHIVRQIADQLIGSGLAVWFFEYQTAVFYDENNEILAAIREGIQHSKKGICFTSDSYAKAPVCIMEMNALISQKGISNIIEVALTQESLTHQQWPELKQVAYLAYESINQVLTFIKQIRKRYIYKQEADLGKSNRFTFSDYERPYSLDLAGWRLRSEQETIGFNDDNTYGASFLYVSVRDKLTISTNIVIGDMTPDTSRHSILNEQYNPDERAFFAQVKHAATSIYGYCSRPPIVECVGAHLYFLKNISPWSQFAVTAIAKFPQYRSIHSRLYSIVLPTHSGASDVEFVFNAFFHGRVEAFYRNVYLMDHIVQSLRWE